MINIVEKYEKWKDENENLTSNFKRYKSSLDLKTYYDVNFIENYRLVDLSDNNNDGEIVNCEIVDSNYDEFTEVMKSKYEYLYSNSSTLFERSMKGDLNMQQLNFMLDMIEKVNAGADYQTTSTVVGQRLVNIYVKPLIDDKENDK